MANFMHWTFNDSGLWAGWVAIIDAVEWARLWRVGFSKRPKITQDFLHVLIYQSLNSLTLTIAEKTANKEASPPCPRPAEAELKEEEEAAEAAATYSDVVNVSEGFQLRTAYKKKVRPSKLDGLLERRVKQFTLEEKQRLERMRHAKSTAAKLPPVCKAAEPTPGARQQQQQPAASPLVKREPKDDVVKKLDFEEEQKEVKKENVDVKAEAPELKEAEMDGVQGNGKEALQELNGGSPAKTEVNSKNDLLSADVESKESLEAKEGKMEVDHSRATPPQVNGGVEVGADSDQAGRVQCENKDPLKSLVNGNVSQVDSPECQPPPLKVPKLENHVAERGAKNEDPPSSSAPRPSSISTDGTDSEAAKATSAVSQSTAAPQTASSNSTGTTTTTQTSSKAALPHKAKALGPDAKAAAAPPGSMTISKEYSTRDKVSLLKFSKTKKARSGTALPSYRKFVTKSSKKSIFILPNDDLKKLARRGSIREVPIFNYNAKPALDIWPYPSPRPTFGITWRSISTLI